MCPSTSHLLTYCFSKCNCCNRRRDGRCFTVNRLLNQSRSTAGQSQSRQLRPPFKVAVAIADAVNLFSHCPSLQPQFTPFAGFLSCSAVEISIVPHLPLLLRSALSPSPSFAVKSSTTLPASSSPPPPVLPLQVLLLHYLSHPLCLQLPRRPGELCSEAGLDCLCLTSDILSLQKHSHGLLKPPFN